ncbi:MAG: FKBP-type peptidyl-prolyl cis-trans isomerase [Jatrophihabitantaceae bacterium]
MPTNKQRRDSARRHLERQLQRRQEREARRRQLTLIASIAGTVVLIAVLVIVFVIIGGSDTKKKTTAGGKSTTPPVSPTATPTPTPSTSYPTATGPTVTFAGVTVKGAKDLKGSPVVTSKSAKSATKLATKDLVLGTGKAATPTSSVSVQYYGVLYKNGQYFDSSWKRGMPAQFPLTGVVKGFTQGIGGTKGVAPMKVGGRRIIIVPSALGYGPQAQPGIPANSSLVFIVDLKAVSP